MIKKFDDFVSESYNDFINEDKAIDKDFLWTVRFSDSPRLGSMSTETKKVLKAIGTQVNKYLISKEQFRSSEMFNSGIEGIVIETRDGKKYLITVRSGRVGLEDHQVGSMYFGYYGSMDSKNKILGFSPEDANQRSFGDVGLDKKFTDKAIAQIVNWFKNNY